MHYRHFLKRSIQVTCAVLFVGGNIFFFQNCAQPFESRSDGEFQTDSLFSSGHNAPRIGASYVYGDMLVDARDLDALNAKIKNEPASLNSASTHATGEEMWPGNVIPIRVTTDNADFSATDLDNFKKSVFAACRLWAQEANISCVPHTNEQYVLDAVLTKDISRYCGPRAGACANYPSANPVRGLWANVTSPELSSLMVHEIGHSLGLIHEHQSDNVDKYYDFPSVTSGSDPFLYYQILPLKYTNFVRYFVNSDYDPQSIMHYDSITGNGVKAKIGYYYITALSRQGASLTFSNGAGVLTVNDVLGLQKLYGARAGSQPTCNDPDTQKPHFFENTMQGYFASKVASEYGTTCRLENRICKNGQLSGSFREHGCQVLCITGDGKTLQVFEKIKAFVKNTTPNDANYGKYEEFEIECRVAGGIAILDKNGELAKIGLSKDAYLTKPTETPQESYSWQAASYGSCSATPSYSYGSWSQCSSNSTQTRSAQCVNTSGTQSRAVVCKNSSGQVVADSLCSAQTKPVSSTDCTANCAGSPVTSQTCNYVPVETHAWETSAYGNCSANPSYSYGAWSVCSSNSTQTRSAQCVNTTGTRSRNVVCRSSSGQAVADSLCSAQAKPVSSTDCSANCVGSPDISQSCQYVEACPVGTCKSLGAKSTFFAPATQVNVRVQSGESKEVFGSNRTDVNIIVSKGAAVTYNDQPGTKRVYFEGSAREYSLSKGGNIFQIKDSCGNISSFTIGQDLGIKFIFSDGIQEFRLIPGSNAFRYVSQGVLKSVFSMDPGEFMVIGYNYLDPAETSVSFFSGACRM